MQKAVGYLINEEKIKLCDFFNPMKILLGMNRLKIFATHYGKKD